jgi:alkanesulfonate monooxygenase SsuD/methylene tetrahydromethanopterin reductase-like flavin-dependent oxidoreductase (luciferase family)
LTLGLGAGWQEREHTNYGWDLLPIKQRFDRFEEGVEVISRLLHSDQPVTFSGNYFRISDGILLPRPVRNGGPPILIGGNGQHRTLPLVARHANEWNAVLIPPAEIHALNKQLDEYLRVQGREPQTVRRSLMTGCVFGVDGDDFNKKMNQRWKGQRTLADLQHKGFIVGTVDEIVKQCQRLAQVGVQRVMLQWLDLDDIAGLEAMAEGILGRLSD